MIAEPYYVGKYLKTTLSGSPASLGVTVLVELEMGKNDLKVMSVEGKEERGRAKEKDGRGRGRSRERQKIKKKT